MEGGRRAAYPPRWLARQTMVAVVQMESKLSSERLRWPSKPKWLRLKLGDALQMHPLVIADVLSVGGVARDERCQVLKGRERLMLGS